MTAVDVDALAKLRDELAELAWGVLVAAGMRDGTRAPSPSVTAHAIVGNLLPVVDRIANERAAAELEAAAGAWEKHGNSWRQILAGNSAPFAYARWVRARAAALRESTS